MIMKHLLAPLALLALPLFSFAQDLPVPSPASTVTQRIGLTDVSITYSRPSAKGRKVFGDLVPYGEVWRTGANKATMLSTNGPLLIEGQELPAGKYSVFTIPYEGGAWEVIFNRNTELWGAYERKPEEDVLRVKCNARDAQATESFTIAFDNLGNDGADLVFRWANTEALVSLKVDSKTAAIKNITIAVADPKADFRTYARSASYYLDNDLGVEQALAWATKSVSLEKKYWNTFTLAKAQAASGKYSDAVSSAMAAVELARAEKDEDAVKSYQAKADEWSAKAAEK
jgi:hypothetical protein